ncbi:MAG: hypothetical protein OIF50_02250 [Flavobacteriaceae bacterium]|nr:hypothetical protein [Flavobacteriaceae bacterium]
MKYLNLPVLMLFCVLSTYGQEPANVEMKSMDDTATEQPKHQLRSYVNKEGKYFVQPELPIYLYISTKPTAQNAHQLKSEDDQEYSNPMYLDGHGKHFIRHRDLHRPVKNQEVTYEVYADARAPISRLKLKNAPRYVKKNTVYYGKGLQAINDSKDEMSGIQNNYMKIDSSAYRVQNNAYNITTEGAHKITTYAVDNVGNTGKTIEREFVVDLTAPISDMVYTGPEVTVQSERVTSPKGKYKLSASDSITGVKHIEFGVSQGSLQSTKRRNFRMKDYAEGNHDFFYRSEDMVKNVEEIKKQSFFLDKTGPEIEVLVEGDQFHHDEITYVSERSKVALKATDNKAGVQSVFFSIDDKVSFFNYTESFPITKNTQIHHYGIDKVENKGKLELHESLLYLDSKAPDAKHEFIGRKFLSRDTMFIRQSTKVQLLGLEDESGLQKIDYKLDEKMETTYDRPFTVDTVGIHHVSYKTYDNVNNSSASEFFFFVDDDAPEIIHHFGAKPLGEKKIGTDVIEIHSEHSKLYLAATDGVVGTDKLFYSINGGKEKEYTKAIVGFEKGKTHNVDIRAVDYLGNSNYKQITFAIIE